MKKVLLMCAFVMGISAVSFAQGGRPPQTPESSLERLKTRAEITGITDDQATKIKAIYAVSIKSTDSLRAANAGGDRMAIFSKMQPITAAANAKIMAILTPEQAAAFKKYNDAQAERMKQMQQGGN